MLPRQNKLILFAFFLIITNNLALCAKTLELDIGLQDSSTRNYLSASKNYAIYELSPENEISKMVMKRSTNDSTLIRFGLETANKLIIAASPDLSSSSNTLLFSCNEKEPLISDSDCILTIKDTKYVAGKKYRGSLLIKANKSNFSLINRLGIEDYLKGVVPSEMPSSWHTEALKAQSVAARTYTVSNLNRRKTLGYDLKPTVEDQVYLGYSHETQRTNQAIKATEGLIMVDKQKKPVEAFFYSQAGFATASPDDIWGIEPHAYLRPKIMIDNSSFWQKNFSSTDLNTKLKDLKFTTLKAVTVLNTTPEGRVKDILISGDKNSQLSHIKLTGEELRHKLGLRSTFFDTKVYGDFQIGFIGKGFGHGIGMSQYGAKKLAEQGKSFKDILQFFYSDINFIKI